MRKRRMRLKTKLIIFVILLAVAVVVIIFFDNATKVIISVSSAQMRAMNTAAVDYAVSQTLSGIRYDDLVDVKYDEAGDVISISSDSVTINNIARKTAYLTQTKLTEMSEGGLEVPLGAFTGIEAIAGFGDKVNVKIIPVVSVECSFVSSFRQAGVNQTLHTVYLEVLTQITVVLSARTNTVTASAEVMICESIINGKIPDVYLQGGLLGGNSLAPD